MGQCNNESPGLSLYMFEIYDINQMLFRYVEYPLNYLDRIRGGFDVETFDDSTFDEGLI